MAGVRLNQQLSQTYNPDGTPGTVSTGVEGPPGPPPTDGQVAAAVTQYLAANPADSGFKKLRSGIVTNDADFLAVGVGVDGSGAWIDIGTYGSVVDGYVLVDSTADNADLHLKSKGPQGRIWVNSSITSVNAVTIDQDLTVLGNVTVGSNGNESGTTLMVGSIFAGSTMSNAGPQSQITSLRAGNSSFSLASTDGGWFISSERVAIAPSGGLNNDGAVSVYDPSTGGGGGTRTYWPVRASAFTVSSDRRLKDDVVPLTGSLDEVRTTPVYSYVMNGEPRRGLIADEAPPAVVRMDDTGLQMIDLYDVVGTLWNAVRELAQKLEDVTP